jgi:hypothetical protein
MITDDYKAGEVGNNSFLYTINIGRDLPGEFSYCAVRSGLLGF